MREFSNLNIVKYLYSGNEHDEFYHHMFNIMVPIPNC